MPVPAYASNLKQGEGGGEHLRYSKIVSYNDCKTNKCLTQRNKYTLDF